MLAGVERSWGVWSCVVRQRVSRESASRVPHARRLARRKHRQARYEMLRASEPISGVRIVRATAVTAMRLQDATKLGAIFKGNLECYGPGPSSLGSCWPYADAVNKPQDWLLVHSFMTCLSLELWLLLRPAAFAAAFAAAAAAAAARGLTYYRSWFAKRPATSRFRTGRLKGAIFCRVRKPW